MLSSDAVETTALLAAYHRVDPVLVTGEKRAGIKAGKICGRLLLLETMHFRLPYDRGKGRRRYRTRIIIY